MSLQENPLSWEIEIPLINNRFILLNVAKGCVLSVLLLFAILGSIFGLTTGVKGLVFAFKACLWVLLFIVVISILTLVVALGNKYPLEFVIDDKGITMKSQSGRAKTIHRLTLILGLLGQNMGAIAAGGSARAGEMFFCSWKDIKSVRFYPEKKVIAAEQNFIQTMYLFCTDGNYKEVSDLITSKTARSK